MNKKLNSHTLLAGFFFIATAAISSGDILYSNAFEQVTDMSDWTFSSLDYTVVADTDGYLYAPGGWGSEKLGTLTVDPLSVADISLDVKFSSIGNDNGYLGLEVRENGGYHTGVSFEMHRYYLAIYDGGVSVGTYYFNTGNNAGFNGMDIGTYRLTAAVAGSTFTAQMYRDSTSSFLLDGTGNNTFSGSLSTALSAGNIAMQVKTYTDSPRVYDYTASGQASAIPEPTSAMLLILGLAACARTLRRRLS